MDKKTTRRNVLDTNRVIIRTGYCALQNLLSYEVRVGYTCGVYGWNADVFFAGWGVAIVTGYRPFGNYEAHYDICQRYEERAKALKEQYYNSGFIAKRDALRALIEEFVKEVTTE